MTTSSPRDLADLRESIARAMYRTFYGDPNVADETDWNDVMEGADAVLAVVGPHVEALEAQVERVRALADEWLQYARDAAELGHDAPMMTWSSAAQRIRAALAPQPAATEEGRP